MEDKEQLEDILDGKEIAELEMFLERPILVEAVKKVLMRHIESTIKPGKPLGGFSFLLSLVSSQMARQGVINHQALGEDLQASYKAMSLIMTAFGELDSLKVVKEEKEKKVINVAR